MNFKSFSAALAVLCATTFTLGTAATAPAKPNVIVFYTDDHGFADLGIQGSVKDIKTPNIDALARSGVLAKHGYSTAPQCVPSRAGLMVGKFQGRFNVDHNGEALDGFNKETTIATRLQKAGYVTAHFGKWHLGATEAILSHGFKHSFSQSAQRPFSSNITLDGQDRPMSDLPPTHYHVDACSRAAASIIERYKEQPFFLYIAYRAPHTPLDAPKVYTARFPGAMPERRRQALGMISAVDDGVGLITDALKKNGLAERTLIFLIGDNGAPLKIHKTDSPLKGDPGGWDGSLNDPLNGEKGMLAEGGMHTPFVVAWPGTIPGGQTYEHPVSALDVAATAAGISGIETKPGDLDGVNLVPHLKGDIKTPPHDALYWRWMAQSAIREGNWKLLRGGAREYLYDLGSDLGEKNNLAAKHPDIAARLRAKLSAWCAELNPPGLALGPMAPAWNAYFDHYLEGKTVTSPPEKKRTEPQAPGDTKGWQSRNGTLTREVTLADSARPDCFDADYIKTTLIKVAEWQLQHLPPRYQPLGADSGVFHTGLLAAYEATGDEAMLTAVIKMAEGNQWKPGPKLMFPDHHIILNPYIELFRLRKEPRMLKPAKEFVEAYLKSPHNDTHNKLITWWLCDYVFMDAPVFVKLGLMLDRPELLATNDRLWRECYDLLFDEQQNLLDVSPKNAIYKGFNGPDPGQREANGEKIFWGCGNGWVLGGLALMLKELPADYKQRPMYEDVFKRMARRLAALQHADGTWGASLLDPQSYPNPESTGSSLITFGLAYGVNAGLLPRTEFEPVVKKAWVGLCTVCLQPDFRVGWSEGSTAKPIRTYDRDSYHLFSTGAFLLAGSEVIRK